MKTQVMEQTKKADNSVEDILQWIDEDTDRAFERLLPAEEYGENEDAELLYQVIHDAGIHLKSLQSELSSAQEKNRKLLEALKECNSYCHSEKASGEFAELISEIENT